MTAETIIVSILTPETVEVNGVPYTRQTGPAEKRIVILQRGWVAVGRWHREGDEITLTNASIIRRWGTSKGLGELVAGPLTGTTLDPAGTMRFHALTVVATLDCEEGKWVL